VVQVENEELVYGAGTRHFAGFFSTSGILASPRGTVPPTPRRWTRSNRRIEQIRSGPAPAQPDLFIMSPSSWSALRTINDDLHRYILSPDPTREEANQLSACPFCSQLSAIPATICSLTPASSGKR